MDKDLEIKRRLVALLDELLEKDYWQDSLFLQAAAKEIKELRAKITSDPRLIAMLDNNVSKTQKIQKHTADLVPVYIALYQADGSNFGRWAQMLAAISHLSINRPIYRNERDIKSCMRVIEKKQNHAYLEVLINKEDILPTLDNPPCDRNGYELLLVKERAIKPVNIVKFTHITGSYQFQNNQLIQQNNCNFNDI